MSWTCEEFLSHLSGYSLNNTSVIGEFFLNDIIAFKETDKSMSWKQTLSREFEEYLWRQISVSRNSLVTGAKGSKIETQLASNSGH
jgi:putative flippase GtrA